MTHVQFDNLDVDVLISIAEMVAFGVHREYFKCCEQTDSGFEVIVSNTDVLDDKEPNKFRIVVLRHFKRNDDYGDITDYEPPLQIADVTIDTHVIDALVDIGTARIGDGAVEAYIRKVEALAATRNYNSDHSDALKIRQVMSEEVSS